jgi:hypothetical protein
VTSPKSCFVYYRTARHPDLRKITDAVDALDEDITLSSTRRT